ncbi:MAG TPA: glycosyltransferase family 2 protein, partial [Chitinophagaceae bacterium]|nr:glycosyltransferase family 2 protein [Chitinophagaceae bacterium]
FYSYIGYALIISLIIPFKKQRQRDAYLNELPEVTLVIASYNEEKVLADKMNNTAELNYPAEKLFVIAVTDGSTDNSHVVLSNYKKVQVIHEDERKGKAAALNRAIRFVKTPLVVFNDANGMLNSDSIHNIVQHFSNEKTGAVAGEKKVIDSSGMGTAEGWYWKYESFMKRIDASFNSVISAAGEVFAIRTNLYEPLSEDVILDDFILSMQVCLKGYNIVYEPRAFAIEMPSICLKEEEKRKVRIATGAFQSLQFLSFKKLVRKPLLFFQFFSRRWLRWVVCPPTIIAILLINIALSLFHTNVLYDYLLMMQLVFYLLAVAGWVLIRRNHAFVLTTLPFYFLFMNFCMLKGAYQFLKNRQTVIWPKAKRTVSE